VISREVGCYFGGKVFSIDHWDVTNGTIGLYYVKAHNCDIRPTSFRKTLMSVRRPAAVAVLTLAALTSTVTPAGATNPTLHLSKVYVNSPGTDNGSNSSLNAEYVVVKNASSTTAYKLTGYSINDRSAHVYKFPTFTLKAGASVTVHTGSGTNTSANLYWGSKAYIWTNSGDTAYLKNSAATLKDSCTWGAVTSYVNC
jgi:hypothetical protein